MMKFSILRKCPDILIQNSTTSSFLRFPFSPSSFYKNLSIGFFATFLKFEKAVGEYFALEKYLYFPLNIIILYLLTIVDRCEKSYSAQKILATNSNNLSPSRQPLFPSFSLSSYFFWPSLEFCSEKKFSNSY